MPTLKRLVNAALGAFFDKQKPWIQQQGCIGARYSSKALTTTGETVIAPVDGYAYLAAWFVSFAAIRNNTRTNFASGTVWEKSWGDDHRCFIPCRKGDSITTMYKATDGHTPGGSFEFYRMAGS